MGRKLANTRQKYPQPINEESTKAIRLKFRPQPKSTAQALYLESLNESPLTIGAGPAGSGKSFLAMAAALDKLLSNEVSKIVLTRPICEAGEQLGFLPGTFEEKISPYLRPLLDAMEELVGVTMAKKLIETGKVEFAPLAYMRGRTFNNCFVILDEAQNTTPIQMKLFVTRAGNYSTFVVNGDASQCDLDPRDLAKFGGENGLSWITRRLRGRSRMVNVIEFGHSDIQRSELVAEVLMYLDGPDDLPQREDRPYRRTT